MIKIDKSIPIPSTATSLRRYPWNEMEIGDSFFLPGAKANSVSSTAANGGRPLGRKYSVRTLTEDGVKGVRCWRVA